MSVSDIMNYVSKTPGNTNPAVIKSMVESETYGVLEKAGQMDEETLAMAKRYTDSQRIAYGEKIDPAFSGVFNFTTSERLTAATIPELRFSGDESMLEPGRTVYVYWDGERYVCKVCLLDTGARYIGNYPKTKNTGDTGEPFCLHVNASNSGVLYYVYFEDNGSVASTHTMKVYDGDPENFKAIDPKYLPGVCLPLVDLTDSYAEFFEGMYSTEAVEVSLSASESAMIEQVRSQNLPFILRLKPGNASLIECFCYWSGYGYIGEFILYTEGTRVLCGFRKDTTTGGWIAAILVLGSIIPSE